MIYYSALETVGFVALVFLGTFLMVRYVITWTLLNEYNERISKLEELHPKDEDL